VLLDERKWHYELKGRKPLFFTFIPSKVEEKTMITPEVLLAGRFQAKKTIMLSEMNPFR